MGWDIDLYVECDAERINIAEFNYTHNTNPMIRRAISVVDPYDKGWFEGGSLESMSAGQLRDKLQPVIEELAAHPESYKKFDAKNGWGKYETLLPVLTELLAACSKFPSAKIYASF